MRAIHLSTPFPTKSLNPARISISVLMYRASRAGLCSSKRQTVLLFRGFAGKAQERFLLSEILKFFFT